MADQQSDVANGKLAAALSIARLGLRVFPLVEGSKLPLIDGYPDKATTDPERIAAWFGPCPVTGWPRDYNIGIATGRGLIVLDEDNKGEKTGAATLSMLTGAHEPLPPTLVSETPTGGRHYLFRCDDDLRNSVENLGSGLDTRGHGGYIVAPGSTLPTGEYRWRDPAVAQAQLPAWLRAKLKVRPPKQKVDLAPAELDDPADVSRAIQYLEDEAPTATKGAGSDNQTYKIACEVRDRGVSQTLCLQLMLDHWNETKSSPPWPIDRLEKKVANAYEYAENKPGSKSPRTTFAAVEAPHSEVETIDPVAIEAMAWACPADMEPHGPALAEMRRNSPSRYAQVVEAIKLAGVIDPHAAETVVDRAGCLAPRPARVLDVGLIKPRAWIVRDYVIRRCVTVLVAPPGMGKSTFALLLSAAVSSGRGDIAGLEVKERCRVWYYNNEDDEEELERRLAALAKYHGVPPSDLTDPEMLYLNTGMQRPLVVAKRRSDRRPFATSDVDDMIGHIRRENIGAFIVDPLIETHELNENDNGELRFVMAQYRRIAQETGCAVIVIHHTRKPPAGDSASHAGNMDSARGGGSLNGVARATFTLYGMDKDTAKKHAIPDHERKLYVRLDDAKGNMSLAGGTRWYRKMSVPTVSPASEFAGGEPESVGTLAPITLELPKAPRSATADDFPDGHRGTALTVLTKLSSPADGQESEAIPITDEAWREAFYASPTVVGPTQDAKQKAFIRSRNNLLRAGLVERTGDGRFLPRNGRTGQPDMAGH